MCVHSHADAPESSGAFFHDIGIGKCRKQAGRLRNGLRLSERVHATDVMLNEDCIIFRCYKGIFILLVSIDSFFRIR